MLKAMEEAGRRRRGNFVDGLGVAQFAAPGAEDRLRACRQLDDDSKCILLAATDPASPWGNILPWPQHSEKNRLQRVAGALVIGRNGLLLCWLPRTRQQLTTFSDLHIDDTEQLQSFSAAVGGLATPGHPLLLTTIDGAEARQSALAPALNAAGFRTSAKGLLHRGPRLD